LLHGLQIKGDTDGRLLWTVTMILGIYMLWRDLRSTKDDDGKEVQMEEQEETTEVNGRIHGTESPPRNEAEIELPSQVEQVSV
jgi:hypothetical protein